MSKLIFNDSNHEYFVEETGARIYSVTQCIKLLEEDLYTDIPKTVLEKAAEYGTRIHKILEEFEDGIIHDDLTVYEENAIKQYNRIKDFETLEKEIAVMYEDVYCGRVDGIGNKIIYDIKTTNKINHKHVKMQLSLYLLAYDYENYDDYKGYVLWLPKKGIGEKVEIELYSRKDILNIVEYLKFILKGLKKDD